MADNFDAGWMKQQLRTGVPHRVLIGAENSSAAAGVSLELRGISQALLLNRMTTAQRDAIPNPVPGMVIYNTTTNKLNFRAASAWEAVTSA